MPERASPDSQHDNPQKHDENILTAPSSIEGSRIRQYTVNSHGICDVLDPAISERLISANKLVLDLLVDAARDEDLARVCDALKARGDIHAITVDVVLLDDDIAQIDADPIFDPLLLRERRIAPKHVLLDHDSAAHGLHGTVEYCKEPVAGRLDEAAMMFRNAGLD